MKNKARRVGRRREGGGEDYLQDRGERAFLVPPRVQAGLGDALVRGDRWKDGGGGGEGGALYGLLQLPLLPSSILSFNFSSPSFSSFSCSFARLHEHTNLKPLRLRRQGRPALLPFHGPCPFSSALVSPPVCAPVAAAVGPGAGASVIVVCGGGGGGGGRGEVGEGGGGGGRGGAGGSNGGG